MDTEVLSTAARKWFGDAFAGPTEVQKGGWQAIAQRRHVLLLAPTGSGKTLAAFLMAIDRLIALPPDSHEAVRVLYVSPLKALVYDIERNLRAPLVGLMQAAQRQGLRHRQVTVGLRTGDTPQKEREQQKRHPPDILVTTPESLYLLLGGQARENLKDVDTVIVDEAHALTPNKRGAHLSLSLERLSALTDKEPQRIGLSATVHPTATVAQWLGGDRPVDVIDCSAPARLDLRIEVPVEDMERPPPADAVAAEAHVGATKKAAEPSGAILGQLAASERKQSEPPARQQQTRESQGLWASIYPQILAQILAKRATIVFVNSRSLCERMAQRINEMADTELVRAHHGSLSLRQRSFIEEALKDGTLRGIVATSSLELGIDMGRVDQVLLIESPGSVARGLQRIGRAGHQVGGTSLGIIYPKHRGDLLESTVVGARMRQGELEPLGMVRHALDVLAQQLVAMCLAEPQPQAALFAQVRRAAPYATLPEESFLAVLDMLSGTYPSDEFTELRPLLRWDRKTDVLCARPGARLTSSMNAGVIADRGMYGVFLAPNGPRVGELDEEMVHESRRGDLFLLGASCWRIELITRDRVLVTPAPGEAGRMPFWRGEGPGRPISLGRAVGEMTRTLGEMAQQKARKFAQEELKLDRRAAQNLLGYLTQQRAATGALPTDRTIIIERFIDEVGDWRICILSPFGARVHAPWALALEATLSEQQGFAIETLYTDDGIVLRMAEGDKPPAAELLLPEVEGLEERIVTQLQHSALFAANFRENAGRALLLPKRRGQSRTPLWQQRLRAKTLLAAAQRYPSFPIVLETYRQCLQDIFDVPALSELLLAIAKREVRLVEVETQKASPFARSLAYAYVAQYLYADDAPLAERRAAALSLDRDMLRELLGQTDLRELIDPAAPQLLEDELQHRAVHLRARDADELVRLLVRLGELTREEISLRVVTHDDALRAQDEPDFVPSTARFVALGDALAQQLVDERRAAWAHIAQEQRLVAIEDFARLRDALGVVPPGGLPARLLGTTDAPLVALVRRYARCHGPFQSEDVARRLGLAKTDVEPALAQLQRDGELTFGALAPDQDAEQWCDNKNLRRLKRLSLGALRDEVAAVDPAAFARFLQHWQGTTQPRSGDDALMDAVTQLAGLPLSFRSLITDLLPARVREFSVDALELLCATGALIWVGAGALGSDDGRIALWPREHAALLPAPPERAAALQTPVHDAILARLEERGAAFSVELQQALGPLADGKSLDEALWDLVWAGHITNDTLQPLRQLGRRRQVRGYGGRWSLVTSLRDERKSDTERTLLHTQMLLHRVGIVTREAAAQDARPGGFASLYAVLKSMESAGKVRRGYFVDGLGGAQFGYAGAIESLRSRRESATDAEPPANVIAVIDPANPYGSLVPWPATRAEAMGRRLRRVPRAQLIVQAGHPLAYLEASGTGLQLFAYAHKDGSYAHIIAALREVVRRQRRPALTLKAIDGTPALRHQDLALWLEAGAERTFDGVRIMAFAKDKTHA